MSSPIIAPVPTGAYIIRNRQTSNVLHAETANAVSEGTTTVEAHKQDECQFNHHQIWWVEPLAEYTTDSSKGLVYSITSPYSGKALEANPESGMDPCGRSRGRC